MRTTCGFRRSAALITACFAVHQILLCFPLQAWANPHGGQVAAGQATIQQQGSTVTVQQATHRAVINWQGFSIGTGETTRFVQPGPTSALLNRVLGFGPSRLDGSLLANGQVFLINPNGVIIGPGGRIETGGFVASTLNVPDAAFMAGGNLLFAGDSAAGIQNLGVIKATEGDIILVARSVENAGTLLAPGGTVGLAAGNEVLYRPTGTERLFVKSALTLPEPTDGVTNTGLIEAAQAELRAAGGHVYALAVNNGGAIHATGVSAQGGRVLLTSAGGAIAAGGTITAKQANGDGGEIRLQAEGEGPGTVTVSGTLDASGTAPGATGGSITVTGTHVTLTDTARLDASGDAGGGLIRVGGDYQGQNPDVHNATTTTVEAGAELWADALTQGSGGRVIVWADDATRFLGRIWARGGSLFGDGGFAEVSGHRLTYKGFADLRAPNGAWGTLLLDPTDVNISDGWADTAGGPDYWDPLVISTQLAGGDLDIWARNSITFDSGAINWSSGRTLKLRVVPLTGVDAAGLFIGDNPFVDPRTPPSIVATNGGGLYLEAWEALRAGADVVIDVGPLTIAPVVNPRDIIGNFSLPGKVVTSKLTILAGGHTSCGGGACSFSMDNALNRIPEIVIGDGAGPFPAAGAAIQALPGNFSIRSSTSTSVETRGWVQFEGNFTLRTDGDLTLKNYLGFDPTLTGETVILSAGGKFLNTGTPLTLNRGVGVPPLVSQLPYVSRMLVFSADPRNDNYGADTSTWYPSVYGDPRMEGRIYDKSVANLGSLPAGNWFVYSLAPVVTLAPRSDIRVYGDANPTLWSASGVILDDVISGAPTLGTVPTERTDVGEHAFVLAGTGNMSGPSGYAFVVDNATPGKLTITKRDITVAPLDVTRQYGDANAFSATYGGLTDWDKDPVTGAPLPGVLGGARLYAQNFGGPEVTQQTGVGTYMLWADTTGFTSTNYRPVVGWAGTNLTITQAPLTVTADNIIRRIGDPNPPNTETYTGLMAWDRDAQGKPLNASVVFCCGYNTPPAADAPPGNSTITPSGGWAPNYTITYVDGTFTVKAPYQLIITASDASKVYGNPNPAFAASYVGFEDGDTVAKVTGLSLTTPAGDRSGVGTYAITPGSATFPPYYSVVYVPGRLQVTLRDLNLYATNTTTRYGTTPAFGFTTDLLSGDVLSSQPALTAGGGVVGVHPIFLTGGAAPNYSIIRHNGLLTVIPAPLSVQANDTSVISGQPYPRLTATLTGLLGGDAESVLQGLNLILDHGKGSTAGANGNSLLSIIQSGALTAANYAPILFTPGTLTTLPAPPVLIVTTIPTTTLLIGTSTPRSYWPIFSPPFGVPAEGANALRYVAWNIIRRLGLNVPDIDAWMMKPENRALMTPALLEFLKAPLQPGTGLYNQREIVKQALENQIRVAMVKIAEDAVARYNAWKVENRKQYTRLEGLLGNLDVPPEDFAASAATAFLQGMNVAALGTLVATFFVGGTSALVLPAVIAPFAASVYGTASATTAAAATLGGAVGISGVAAGVVLAVTGTVVRALQFVEYQKVEDKYNNLVNNARSFDIDTLLSGDSNAQSQLFGLMLGVATSNASGSGNVAFNW